MTLLSSMAGCHHATGQVVSPKMAGNEPGQQIEFWHALNDEKVTTNDQAFHALLLFVDGKDDANNYEGRVAALKAKKIIPANFNEPAGQAVSRGIVAVAIVKILHIRGGVTMMLLGPIPRYAVRELIFMNLYPPGSAQQTFTGPEFVGIMGRV